MTIMAKEEARPATERFRLSVPEETLRDLSDRISRTRWPDQIPGADWDYGTNLDFLRDLLEYWRDEFDWRAREAEVNRWPHFLAEVDGLRIHFLHARSEEPGALPILLTHGWPSTFLEMSRLIPLLTDPAAHGAGRRDAFHVVVPSLPGYGFSEIPKRRGLTKTR
ncbi:MAG TPA: epoxide hydrolase, partial [Thermoanaerobaculia bacterium]